MYYHKLRPFFFKNIHKINWQYLAKNPNAVHLIEGAIRVSKYDKLDAYYLSQNTNAINIILDKPELIHWNCLSSNTSAHPIFEKYKDQITLNLAIWSQQRVNVKINKRVNLCTYISDGHIINWDMFYQNPAAIDILYPYISQLIRSRNLVNKQEFSKVSANPSAIRLLNQYPQIIDFEYLSGNPNARNLLVSNLDKVCWHRMSENPSMIDVLKENLDKICKIQLSRNINAVHILEQHQELIHWPSLSYNSNAIKLLSQNLDKVDNDLLTLNSGAVEILENNPKKINWNLVWANPSIFECGHRDKVKQEIDEIERLILDEREVYYFI